MTNPFENTDGTYLVLMNDEGQYSLWPAFAQIPAGWNVVYEQASRQECLNHINSQWTDMRPKSVL
ncbi:MbtH protein [Paenibacillus sp. DS2015]|uniref:MbtH family protein n=1 Tax=Paenibacillus sp. DS2015 TaxID=3373917 RepID=UPI003D190021